MHTIILYSSLFPTQLPPDSPVMMLPHTAESRHGATASSVRLCVCACVCVCVCVECVCVRVCV